MRGSLVDGGLGPSGSGVRRFLPANNRLQNASGAALLIFFARHRLDAAAG